MIVGQGGTGACQHGPAPSTWGCHLHIDDFISTMVAASRRRRAADPELVSADERVGRALMCLVPGPQRCHFPRDLPRLVGRLLPSSRPQVTRPAVIAALQQGHEQ
ncbi:hypothetical protein XFF6166_670073 [Xanthomonas citri pv. fuscans]|nr:hypothetical protein XFF6166_670073 [Xanthomonas citri pv. fuscans]SOO01703.1 hypothetical protein XFF6960_520073 [Xanthomonas citri pv. fuscans]SOO04281.1 hypothetical protein XFF7767_240122 [Xanthomonas citri pv. fuscans]SOO08425.1 hypothetical protein XFF6970_210079 [Xanthomonas citri pv. fuscans]SOO16703.1 hypothetical protein XFF7766_850122 [Xanthomonas citri pv. fuscans]